MDIKSTLQPSPGKSTSCDDVLDENSSETEKKQLENMPLYPHSILKKGSNSRVTSQPPFGNEEPLIDYDSDDNQNNEINQVSQNLSSVTAVKSQRSSTALPAEDTHLDRPAAKPGRHILFNNMHMVM